MQYDTYNNVSYRYYFLDYKLGDVTGDGVVDRVYLVGEKSSSQELFSENISIVVHDGRTNNVIKIAMEYAAGYNAKLFLGNFTNIKKLDILVKIDTGGSGGYILAYLYSLQNDHISLLLNSESFESISIYDVNFVECFRIEVINKDDNIKYILNALDRKTKYIKKGIYDDKGSLIKETSGSVLALGAIFPIIEEYNGLFKLVVYQRIIGIDNSDNLGAVETYLNWNGEHMEIERVNIVIQPAII
ncbi:VCBS repeat-containing protein [Alkalibaculum sp. M08DMB]|uniref:VCBS repeat-containing protein n=1 Tax=Alkalibaculum sporogenes TaxID=2655001 RepID=A0A6A7K4V9_9FIRM|nr:VCBS repeat-containing protein [Alkalibaculum sporogenes]MPW24499.1 VCBS repeat-containing protein [Alkalibaculum sporogenes]